MQILIYIVEYLLSHETGLVIRLISLKLAAGWSPRRLNLVPDPPVLRLHLMSIDQEGVHAKLLNPA